MQSSGRLALALRVRRQGVVAHGVPVLEEEEEKKKKKKEEEEEKFVIFLYIKYG
jgi:hypothetical protein